LCVELSVDVRTATAGAIYGVTGAVWLERPQFPMMVKGAMRFGGLGLVYFGTRLCAPNGWLGTQLV